MAEYTYKDIIIDPISEEAKNAVGEGCYFGSNPKTVLDFANCNEKKFLRVLECIKPEEDNPFYDYNYGFPCIIVKKKEPKPKYVPFESKEEFVRRYTEVKEGADFDTFEDNLFQCGMWLRYKENGDLILVTGLCDDAIYVRDFTFGATWKEVLNKFEFLDGAPCGKESKE